MKKAWKVFTTLLVTVVVILAILLAGVRIVGLRPFAVLSGSMEPTYHVGSLIYVRDVDPAEIEVGDPITFVMDESLTVATHRVVEIDKDHTHFTTKGDANETVDGNPVYFENIVGSPVFTIPYLGYVSAFISEPPGTYLAVVFGALILLLLFLPEIIKAFRE